MTFNQHGISFGLGPDTGSFWFGTTLRAWFGADFDPATCRAALEADIQRGAYDPSWFAPEEIDHGGMCATAELRYGRYTRDARWHFSLRAGGEHAATSLDHVDASAYASVIRAFARSPARGAVALTRLGAHRSLIDRVLTIDQTAHGRWAPIDAPGIYRREHASVVFRSGTTTLVTDPQFLSGGWTTSDGAVPPAHGLDADAVLVTHVHNDHWHLPSALASLRDETCPVVVPPVPVVNLLTPERPRETLTAAGAAHIELAWNTAVTIGDFQVRALPFFGEQPTTTTPLVDTGLRNWGNTYRIDCPDFSALLLVDSGSDPAGSLREMVARSTALYGPVDFVLCNGRDFPQAVNLGLPDYSLAVPFGQLASLRSRAHTRAGTITAGPWGIAEACLEAGARYFLPYAHGFEGLGVPVEDRQLTSDLVGELCGLGAATELVDWNVGDRIEVAHGRVVAVSRGV